MMEHQKKPPLHQGSMLLFPRMILTLILVILMVILMVLLLVLLMLIVFPLFHNSPNSWLGEDYGRCWSVSVLPCHLSSTTTLLSYSMHTQCHVPLLRNYWNILLGFPLWYQVKDMNRSVFKLNLGMKWHISRTLSLCKTPYNLVIWPPQM